MHFGAGGNAGHLRGVNTASKTGAAVDFREQRGIYCLYDESFRLVYVGQAGGGNDQRLFSRLKQHRDDNVAERWSRFSWFGVSRVLKSGILSKEVASAHPEIPDVLNHTEAILIASAEPVHNRQGGRFGSDVEQYLQWRDDHNFGPEVREMIRDIWKKARG